MVLCATLISKYGFGKKTSGSEVVQFSDFKSLISRGQYVAAEDIVGLLSMAFINRRSFPSSNNLHYIQSINVFSVSS